MMISDETIVGDYPWRAIKESIMKHDEFKDKFMVSVDAQILLALSNNIGGLIVILVMSVRRNSHPGKGRRCKRYVTPSANRPIQRS